MMPRLSPYLLLVIPPLCWAGNFVVGRAVHAEISPMALTFWRWAAAGLVLLPFAAVETWRSRHAALRQWRLMLVLAVTGIVLFQVFVYQGLHTTTAINGALIIATIPVVIPAIAFVLDGARLSVRHGIGIAVSLLGVTTVILQGDPELARRLRLSPGDLWMAMAVPTWALYSVLLRRRAADLPPRAMLLVTIALGLVLLAPAYLQEAARVGSFPLTAGVLGSIAYVGVFASALAFLCWNRGIAEVGASTASLYIHLMPVFAALLAVLFLDERFAGYHALGIALIATGLTVSATATARPR
jgi:drug/metabolite transporter (DMT)-like permease